MLDINNLYHLTTFTSGFLFFTILFLNKFKSNFFNCFAFFSSLIFTELKNIKDDKKSDSDYESQYGSFDELVSNVSSNSIIKKTKSHNNIYKSSTPKENMLCYSHTYNNLSKLVPPNSPSRAILNELIKNKNNNIMACCNPFCREKIDVPVHLAFDGYYCSIPCRNFVVNNMSNYWCQL